MVSGIVLGAINKLGFAAQARQRSAVAKLVRYRGASEQSGPPIHPQKMRRHSGRNTLSWGSRRWKGFDRMSERSEITSASDYDRIIDAAKLWASIYESDDEAECNRASEAANATWHIDHYVLLARNLMVGRGFYMATDNPGHIKHYRILADMLGG
jgi:hypothetical protein